MTFELQALLPNHKNHGDSSLYTMAFSEIDNNSAVTYILIVFLHFSMSHRNKL